MKAPEVAGGRTETCDVIDISFSGPHLVHSGATSCLEGHFAQGVNLRMSRSEAICGVRG